MHFKSQETAFLFYFPMRFKENKTFYKRSQRLFTPLLQANKHPSIYKKSTNGL